MVFLFFLLSSLLFFLFFFSMAADQPLDYTEQRVNLDEFEDDLLVSFPNKPNKTFEKVSFLLFLVCGERATTTPLSLIIGQKFCLFFILSFSLPLIFFFF